MPDTLPLLNLKDTHHLEHLAWAVYDGALLVGSHPELLGECQWCTVLAGIFKHIYKGHDEMTHCLLYTLASWDCQQRMEAACEERRQNAVGTMMDVEPGHGDRGVAPGVILRCQAKRGVPDTPMVLHPTHCHRGTTVLRNSFPQAWMTHPSSTWL